MVRSFAAVLMIMLVAVVRADPAAEPPLESTPPGYPDESANPPAASADVYVYPERNQSDKQLDRDRYECHKWAVAQSGYNPSDPHLAPHQQVQVLPAPPAGRETVASAISGAVTGAIIAGPYDTGEGALIGAIAGGFLGAISESARRKEFQQVSTYHATQAESERARLESLASNYRRAIGACLEGRGYTVK
jgi:hypothetical protein